MWWIIIHVLLVTFSLATPGILLCRVTVMFMKVELILRQVVALYNLAECPRESGVKKFVEQGISMIKYKIVIEVGCFMLWLKEMEYEMSTFRHDYEVGLVELVRVKVTS
jgi:hypothetical protein